MNAIPTPAIEDPRALLRHLYDVAVQRALPLHNTAAHLPPPPKGRTLVLGAGKALFAEPPPCFSALLCGSVMTAADI